MPIRDSRTRPWPSRRTVCGQHAQAVAQAPRKVHHLGVAEPEGIVDRPARGRRRPPWPASSWARPTNCTPRPCQRDCSFTKPGISSRQGVHQVAQKLTTRTLPANCAEGAGRALAVRELRRHGWRPGTRRRARPRSPGARRGGPRATGRRRPARPAGRSPRREASPSSRQAARRRQAGSREVHHAVAGRDVHHHLLREGRVADPLLGAALGGDLDPVSSRLGDAHGKGEVDRPRVRGRSPIFRGRDRPPRCPAGSRARR